MRTVPNNWVGVLCEKVRGELKDYFKRLEDKQQAALFSYLDGISQILTAGMQGEEAHSPGEPHSSKHLDDEEEADDERTAADSRGRAGATYS